jgi:NAD(P)H-dependent flavin oxidoreductase YrpB (nitropropane dioxygenase family)
MAIKTALTERLGIRTPIFLAGMGPFSTFKTAEKVANAGGVGVTSHWNIISKVDPETYEIDVDGTNPKAKFITPLDKMKFDLKYLREHINEGTVIGCNVRVARIQADPPQVIRTILRTRDADPVMKERLKVIVTSAGNPRPPAKQIKEWKEKYDPKDDLMHFHVVPTPRHAQKAIESAGCDGVIAAGYEGGGHQSYEGVNTSVLVPQIRAMYPDTPIIASGGFCDGLGLASALTLGADAIQMGTRFIAATDSDFHKNIKEFILKSESEDTMMCSGAFGPIRLLKNNYANRHARPMTKEEKKESEKSLATMFGGSPDKMDSDFMKDMKAYDNMYAGDIENAAILTGETCGGIKSLETVEEIINDITKEAEEVIRKMQRFIT